MAGSTRIHRLSILMAVVVLTGALWSASTELAQPDQNALSALQSLSKNRDKPLQIEAKTREMSDRDLTATFAGKVRVMLGDTSIQCETLTVYYDRSDQADGVKTAEPGPSGTQKVRKLAASGGIVIVYRNQIARGDFGTFEWNPDLASLTGTVMVTQGSSVLRGERLIANLTTGALRMESKSLAWPQ